MPPAVVHDPVEVAMIEAALAEHGRPLARPHTLVYFMQCGDCGPIKIGRANDPLKRRAMLQTGNPYPIRITRVFVGDYTDEWTLQQVFDAIRLQGEWFQPHPSLATVADATPDESLAEAVVAVRDTIFKKRETPPKRNFAFWNHRQGYRA